MLSEADNKGLSRMHSLARRPPWNVGRGGDLGVNCDVHSASMENAKTLIAWAFWHFSKAAVAWRSSPPCGGPRQTAHRARGVVTKLLPLCFLMRAMRLEPR